MDGPASGLIEHLRRQRAAGLPMPPFALFGRDATPHAVFETLKRIADDAGDMESLPFGRSPYGRW